ncbi:MAG: phosphoglycerate mutase [Chloroflexi bacterium]|nr:histidine phosphatase family protein [Anaerolineaceae bacterium]NMB89479.1 phosphoglycerate mutase [Chloroflexota bacterium]
MPILLLIRHGENDYMYRGLAGRLPEIHLNQKGRQQAVKLAGQLVQAPIKAIYSSPMERAVETAGPLAAALGLEIQVEPGLIEVDFGQFEGKTYRQLKRFKLWRQILDAPAGTTFPGGESLSAMQARVVSALEDIASGYQPFEVVACFTHADVIRLALAHFLGMPWDAFQRLAISPASISMVALEAEKTPRVFNVNLTALDAWPQPPQPKKPRRQAKPGDQKV